MNPRAHPLLRHFCHWHPSETSRLCPGYPNPVLPVKTRKPLRVTSLMQLHILAQASLKALIVSTPDLTPWGHWSLHNLQPLPRQRLTWVLYLKNTNDFTDVSSKSKAKQISWPSTLWSQNHSGRRHFLPYGPIYSLSRRNLPLCISSLTKTLVQVNPSILALPWATGPLYSEERNGSLRLCINFLRPPTKISKKDWYHFHSFLDPLDAPWKARVYTKINLQHAYHLVWISPGDKWRLHPKPTMIHSSGW